MTLSGRPLLDTRPDNELFVDRADELGRIRAALEQGLNCLVGGERGSGKTSLVRALMFQARQHEDPEDLGLARLLYVRGAGALSATELLGRAAGALAEYQGDPPAGGWPGTATGLIAELGERAQRGPVVMILDDAAADAGNALFGALRDELWSIDLRWLVTVATVDRGALIRPPTDAFFESQVELAPLPVGASIEILRRRMGDVPDRLLEEAAGIGGGNPRRLLDIARELGDDYSQWSAFSSAAAEREKAGGRGAHEQRQPCVKEPTARRREGGRPRRGVQQIHRLEASRCGRHADPEGEGSIGHVPVYSRHRAPVDRVDTRAQAAGQRDLQFEWLARYRLHR